jgi:hypothetical protein
VSYDGNAYACSSSINFQRANDDGCANGRSVIMHTVGATEGRAWYIAVGGHTSTSTGDYELTWRYDPPTPTASPSRTPPQSRSQAATPSGGAVTALGSCTVSFPLATSALCPSIIGLDPTASQACAAAGYHLTETTRYGVTPNQIDVAITARLAGCDNGYGVKRPGGSGVYDIYLWSVPGVSVLALQSSSSRDALTVQAAYSATGATCSWTYTVTAGSCLGAVASTSSTNAAVLAQMAGTCTLEPVTSGQCSGLFDSLGSYCADGGYDANVAPFGGITFTSRRGSGSGCASGTGVVASSSLSHIYVLGDGADVTARGDGDKVTVTFSAGGASCPVVYSVSSGSCLGAAAPPSPQAGGAAIIGGVIGCVLVAVAVATAAVVAVLRRRRVRALTATPESAKTFESDGGTASAVAGSHGNDNVRPNPMVQATSGNDAQPPPTIPWQQHEAGGVGGDPLPPAAAAHMHPTSAASAMVVRRPPGVAGP